MDQDSLTNVNGHPALAAGRAAVITGGASGIGLAAAKRFVALGMKVCLADLDPAALDRAAARGTTSIAGARSWRSISGVSSTACRPSPRL
jgi:NAD(P)-dependent dehydrogenase (short-subunit alcohol dehydrogenase family)